MNNKKVILIFVLILIAIALSIKADAFNPINNTSGDPYLTDLVGKEVVVFFNSNYPGSGRAAKAKLMDIQDSGLVLTLLDDVKESGTVLEWNKGTVLCPLSGILSITLCDDKKWRRLKGFLKQYKY